MSWVRTLLRKEPAITVGAVVGFLAAVADALADQPNITTWAAALPIIAGVIARRFVVSPATADRRVVDAFTDGIAQGKTKAKKATTKKATTKRAR